MVGCHNRLFRREAHRPNNGGSAWNSKKKSLGDAIFRLEGLFDTFNRHFYGGKLETPVITISPDTTSGAYGWCTEWKAWKAEQDKEDEGCYEINLCAEYLNRPFPEICETLLHEMVHLYNLQEGIQDTSRSGKYHNKRFKAAAEEHGLNVDKSEKYGWCSTELNEQAKVFVNTLYQDMFSFFRTKFHTVKKSTNNSRKYVCPSCGCIVRATKQVEVICGMCGIPFQEESR